MILPIYTYGQDILRADTEPVEGPSEALDALVRDMMATMDGAEGIGLAAPQVGRSERLFVVDLSRMLESPEEAASYPPQPMVFVNPEIVWESDDECDFEEGCLSIPDLRENVRRPAAIRIAYRDARFEPQEIEVDGLLARVIQHEYDHLEGVLFVDRVSAFRRRMLARRLREMAHGRVEADYPLSIPQAA